MFKIIDLNIYGFGQLENVKIDNLSDFQVFFGENEAGKSTIMAFITAVLFGFPTKQQSELRYEPKHSTKYGGSIRIVHEQLGGAVIERVKGKAAGDVKVVIDNGTIGGEELLKELLGNFDKSLFQAIFSFNLYGLQNIHQMKGEELGKFLFSAGTLGTEQLAKTEAILQKELEARFKPTGKKPILNEKLQELHEINHELKKASAKNAEYVTLIASKEKTSKDLADINERLKEIQEQVEKWNEWKKIEAVVKAEKWVEKEIKDLGEIDFPVRGIERLENVRQLILPNQTALNSTRQRIGQIRTELAGIQPDQALLENELAILTALDQVPLSIQLQQEKQHLETKLSDLDNKLAVINERLHLPLSEEEIFSINTNMVVKNQVELVSRKRRKLDEDKEVLEEKYQEETRELTGIKKEVLDVESRCLPKQEREQLEELVKQGNDKHSLELELQNVKDKMEFYTDSINRDQTAKGRIKLQFLIFESIVVGLIVYALLTKQGILAGIGLAGILAVALLMLHSLKQFKDKQAIYKLDEWRKKEKQLIQQLQSTESTDTARLEEQLHRDQQRIDQLQILQFKLNQQKSRIERTTAKLEEWELESRRNNEELQTIAAALRIPEYMAASFLEEAFQQIEDYKAIYREKRQVLARLEQTSQHEAHIIDNVNKFASLFLMETGLELHKTADLLRIRLKEEHKKQIKCQEKEALLNGLEDELKQKSEEFKQLTSEYQKLFDAAKVETEQEFYELGEKAEAQRKLREQYDGLQSQLQYSLLTEQERDNFLQAHYSEELIADYNREIQHLQEKAIALHEKLASIKYEIQKLEEGGVYSDILHHYKQKKYDLEEAAKEWAVFSLAQDILLSTINKYKNDHLPRMLTKAEEFLSFLTNGSYSRIHPHPLGTGFLVEREDHTLFEANELSQATTEQLYVSIRLALATTIYEKYQFPIIIDDSFVNFDAGRTKLVLKLLKRLKQNQILFFTCHSHLLSEFPQENILYLEKGVGQIIS